MTSTRGRKLTVGIFDFLHNQSKIKGFILIYFFWFFKIKGGGSLIISFLLMILSTHYSQGRWNETYLFLSQKILACKLIFVCCSLVYAESGCLKYIRFSIVFAHLHVMIAMVIDINS